MMPSDSEYPEFPVVQGLERTFGAVIEDARAVLQDFAGKMARDRSYKRAQLCLVRAILDGRKTQTRRVVAKPDTWACLTGDCPHWEKAKCAAELEQRSPFGPPGRRLWVRETWRALNRFKGYKPRDIPRGALTAYAADTATGDLQPIPAGRMTRNLWPAIFLPRWACRLVLEVTGVRVERLHDISEADAIAEGFEPAGHASDPVTWYRCLWESLHGRGDLRWNVNPWVWVIDFKKASK